MTVHRDHPSPTDRLARVLVRAARVATPAGEHDRLRVAKRRTLYRLAHQAARQGLTPADLDTPEGADAVHAIAGTISWISPNADRLFDTLPVEWKHVVNAAIRQLDLDLE